MDPTLYNLMQQGKQSQHSGPDLTERREICASEAFASAMSLDQIIVSCIFQMFESFCPDDAEVDSDLAFEIETVQFRLPNIRWDFDVSPPPPPPELLRGYEAHVGVRTTLLSLAVGSLETIGEASWDCVNSGCDGKLDWLRWKDPPDYVILNVEKYNVCMKFVFAYGCCHTMKLQ